MNNSAILELNIKLINDGIKYPRETSQTSFDVFIKLITNKIILSDVKKFIDNIKSLVNLQPKFTERDFLSIFMITENYSEIFNNISDKEFEIIQLTRNIAINFSNNLKYDNLENVSDFLNMCIKYKTLLDDWKKQDRSVIIKNFKKQYNEIVMARQYSAEMQQKKDLSLDDEEYKNLQIAFTNDAENIKNQIKKTFGDNGLLEFNDYNVEINNSDNKILENNIFEAGIKRAFWDYLKYSFINKDFIMLYNLITTLTENLLKLTDEKEHEEIKNNLNISVIKEKINIDLNNTLQYMYSYISDKLKLTHLANSDKYIKLKTSFDNRLKLEIIYNNIFLDFIELVFDLL